MKFIAFYLPQFHEIHENNEWWGKGFTEWDRVKKAKPLYSGHNQPRIPYKYYDLSDIKVIEGQAKIATEYGLDGFCYYHYWFKGKKLLEKPLENMLNNNKVNIPFCLSWANESWTRAWEGNPQELLIKQEYGTEKNWLEHLNYLIPFFQDKRYILIKGKPLFIIYRTNNFKRFDDMILFWQRKLKSIGLKGLYIVETLNSFQKRPSCEFSDAVLEFEPMFSTGITNNRYIDSLLIKLKELKKSTTYKEISYDNIWLKIIHRNKKYKNKTKFLGAFVDWDNTPRFKEKASIFQGATPEKFKKYLKMQIEKVNEDEEIIFVNAWNEWAEGAYLEPDNINGLKFLEAISDLKKQSELNK